MLQCGVTRLLCRHTTVYSASLSTASPRYAPAHTHRVPYIHNNLSINCFHSPPQIRKAAQHGVCSILRGSDLLFTDNAPTHHPAAAMAAKFCIKEIEQAGGTTPNLWGFFFCPWFYLNVEATIYICNFIYEVRCFNSLLSKL